MIIAPARMKKNRIKSTNDHIHFQTTYMARTQDLGEFDELKPIYSNCAGESSKEIINEMQSLASLRPEIKKGTYQIIFSPEKNDRALTLEEWGHAIDIYRKERGLDDAPFAAYLHTDGHKDRHQHHVHLMFVRIKSNGSLVSDSWDSSVQRAASRRIESELRLLINAGADEAHKYNGRDKHVQRERAAERRDDAVPPNVNPEAVAQAIAQSRNRRELKQHLKDVGIECRFRYRNDEVYAWTLRNEGAREWTSGSKLTASNEFGWKKVQDQLDTNFDDRKPPRIGRKHPTRMRGLAATRCPLALQRIDQIADHGTAEALEFLQRFFIASRRQTLSSGNALNGATLLNALQNEDMRDGLILDDFGHAPYLHDDSNGDSFFLRVRTAKTAEAYEIWGIDFERTLENSNAQRGDHIQIDHAGQVTTNRGRIMNKWQIQLAEPPAQTQQPANIKRARPAAPPPQNRTPQNRNRNVQRSQS